MGGVRSGHGTGVMSTSCTRVGRLADRRVGRHCGEGRSRPDDKGANRSESERVQAILPGLPRDPAVNLDTMPASHELPRWRCTPPLNIDLPQKTRLRSMDEPRPKSVHTWAATVHGRRLQSDSWAEQERQRGNRCGPLDQD
jgi:hypothetical protein